MTNSLWLGFGWLFFYAIHSLLASQQIKNRVETQLPKIGSNYRLFYNIVALLLFVPLSYVQLFTFSPQLWALPPAVALGGYGLMTAGAVVLVLSFRNYDLKAFLGLQPVINSDQETLQITGMNRWVRHPLYLGVVLLLFGMWLANCHTHHTAFLLSTLCYLPFGIYWEEQKLIQQFGQAYKTYAARTKILIPLIF
ncbi:MAG TPA: hypothetical protein DCM08_14520 [Microscillaceae bacterium]|nr:hypothetical protein [Microscillaceae bacterium]